MEIQYIFFKILQKACEIMQNDIILTVSLYQVSRKDSTEARNLYIISHNFFTLSLKAKKNSY